MPAAGSSPTKAQPITQGTWNSRLTMPMWLRGVPLVQMIAGELVVDRCEERRAGVPHERDDTVGAGVHEREHVVRSLHRQEASPHRRRVEDLRPPPDLLHAAKVAAGRSNSAGGGSVRAPWLGSSPTHGSTISRRRRGAPSWTRGRARAATGRPRRTRRATRSPTPSWSTTAGSASSGAGSTIRPDLHAGPGHRGGDPPRRALGPGRLHAGPAPPGW